MEDNKTIGRRWFEEVWNQRSTEAIDRRMAADCVVHGLEQSGRDLNGPAEFKPFHQAFLNAFGDLHITVDDVIEEGDRIAIRWTATGRHTGDGLGFPATNKQMHVSGVTIARIRDGKLVEGWNNFDALTMLQQLGAVPAPPAQW
jgi:steroid delta-isomerase-like uncharacterized protein